MSFLKKWRVTPEQEDQRHAAWAMRRYDSLCLEAEVEYDAAVVAGNEEMARAYQRLFLKVWDRAMDHHEETGTPLTPYLYAKLVQLLAEEHEGQA